MKQNIITQQTQNNNNNNNKHLMSYDVNHNPDYYKPYDRLEKITY